MIHRAIISFVNQKGGCGKSSTVFHLAGTFAQRGWRVLLIDTDPQGSLSQAFFGSAAVERLEVQETLAALFARPPFEATSRALVVPTPFSGIQILRANQTLALFNAPDLRVATSGQWTLRRFLTEVVASGATDFDVCLIDCPPNIYQCSWEALLASDFVVVPVPPEDFGAQGLRVVQQALDAARKHNPDLSLLGRLVTRCDRRLRVHQSYERKLRDLFGDTVLHTVVPEATAFKAALTLRRPIAFHDAKSPAAQAMLKLADELTERIEVWQRISARQRAAAASSGGT